MVELTPGRQDVMGSILPGAGILFSFFLYPYFSVEHSQTGLSRRYCTTDKVVSFATRGEPSLMCTESAKPPTSVSIKPTAFLAGLPYSYQSPSLELVAASP